VDEEKQRYEKKKHGDSVVEEAQYVDRVYALGEYEEAERPRWFSERFSSN
jgi:hypothetical protein